MYQVKSVLMRRDNVTEAEADELIGYFKQDLEECIQHGDLQEAEELLMDYFGLEPDYLMEFL